MGGEGKVGRGFKGNFEGSVWDMKSNARYRNGSKRRQHQRSVITCTDEPEINRKPKKRCV